MQQNYSPRLEMQIPQENIYTGFETIQKDEFTGFIEKHFEFPSNNADEINLFINGDAEIKKIIYDLPEIISSELTYSRISLDFMKETDPSEKILEIVVYSISNEETLLQKEDKISDWIIDNYPNPKNEYIILVKFDSKNDYKLKEFLNKHFKFYSDNLNDINNFISEDYELEKIIYGLPEIISKEFPHSPIQLDFSKFSNKDILEIVIKTPFDGKTTSDKKDNILNEIFTKYSKTTNEYFISMEFLK